MATSELLTFACRLIQVVKNLSNVYYNLCWQLIVGAKLHMENWKTGKFRPKKFESAFKFIMPAPKLWSDCQISL